MEIKDIPMGAIHYRMRYAELDANIFDNNRAFCATSKDGAWCCVGVIMDYEENFENRNPVIQVNSIYRNINK